MSLFRRQAVAHRRAATVPAPQLPLPTGWQRWAWPILLLGPALALAFLCCAEVELARTGRQRLIHLLLPQPAASLR